MIKPTTAEIKQQLLDHLKQGHGVRPRCSGNDVDMILDVLAKVFEQMYKDIATEIDRKTRNNG